jgi:hypothetical protein
MSANIHPIFPLTPQVGFATLTAANTNHDGTGTVETVYTAGGDGARVDRIKVRALGTNVATVLRIFINNGSDASVAANNVLYMEATIASTTLSEVAELADTVITLDTALPAGYKINVAIGTAVAAGLAVTCEGGDF